MAATFNAPATPIVIEILVPNENAVTTNYTTSRGLRVIDTWLIKTTGSGTGGAAATVVVSNAGTTIPTLAALGAAGTITRASSIDTAAAVIVSGGSLRTVSTQNLNDTQCSVYVSCIPA